MFKAFRDFALKGNFLDLAIGVIIGAAFGAVVTSLVKDLFTPLLGLALGKVDFSNLYIPLAGQTSKTLAEAQALGPTINIGLFLNALITFVIIAFVMFLVVQGINRMMPKPAAPTPPPATKDCQFCATAIPVKATRCPNCTSQLTT